MALHSMQQMLPYTGVLLRYIAYIFFNIGFLHLLLSLCFTLQETMYWTSLISNVRQGFSSIDLLKGMQYAFCFRTYIRYDIFKSVLMNKSGHLCAGRKDCRKAF